MESAKKFTVDQGSHPRTGDLSPQEVDQALRDIIAWQTENIPGFVLSPPAMQHEQLQNLSLPLEKLYQQHDGGIQLHETFVTLSVSQIQQEIAQNQAKPNWISGSLPFAKNIDGDLLVDSAENGVIVWAEGSPNEYVSQSIGLYLENLRNNLLSRKLEYIEDLGLIERV